MPIKRLFDIVLSALALFLLLPLMLVVAFLIVMESPGSPLFRQMRVGRNGHVFMLFKFRSMVAGAPGMGSWRTENHDPRITKLGKYLRALSLDELPQLWNVLLGDMSIIGPRPNTPQQQSLYSQQQWEARHRVRPGITGLAQVNGRSDLELYEQIDYDLRYAAELSWRLDFHILCKTLQVILRKKE